MSEPTKLFPIIDSGESIKWAHAEQVYAEYREQFSNDQTLERLAERGGFGVSEAVTLLCQRIERLEKELAQARAKK